MREMVNESRWGGIETHTLTYTSVAISKHTPTHILTHMYIHVYTCIYLIILRRTAVPFISRSTDFVEVVTNSKVDSLSYIYT